MFLLLHFTALCPVRAMRLPCLSEERTCDKSSLLRFGWFDTAVEISKWYLHGDIRHSYVSVSGKESLLHQHIEGVEVLT